MNLDIVLDWMKTYMGKVTPNAIQRKFGIAIWKASRIYDMLVKGGHVIDENRKEQLLLESQKEAAPEMYECLLSLCLMCSWQKHPNSGNCRDCKAREILKKARGGK